MKVYLFFLFLSMLEKRQMKRFGVFRTVENNDIEVSFFSKVQIKCVESMLEIWLNRNYNIKVRVRL